MWRWTTWLRALLRELFGGPELPAPPRSWSGREVDHLLDQMAERLGFAREDEGPATRLLGRREVGQVEVTVVRRPRPDGRVRFEQHVRVRAPGPLALTPVTFYARGERAPAWRTWDRAFDRDVTVEGAPDAALALLDAHARAVVAGNGGRWRIAGPELEWRAQRAPNFLAATTEQILGLAASFGPATEDVVAALALRSRHDPDPGVRRRALGLLLERHRADPRAEAAARAALQDRFARLRLDAALALGDEGRETLLQLLAASGTPAGLRQAAANHLEVDDPAARAALLTLFGSGGAARVDAIELLGRLGGPEDLAFLEPLTRAFAGGRRLRQAAVDARSRILARHSDRDAGQLALATLPDLGGAVSAPSD